MDRITQSLRRAWRSLVKTPYLSGAVVVLLALGVGASATVFSFLDLLLFKRLAARQPDDLVAVWTEDPGTVFGLWGWTSYPDYLDYRDRTGVFSDALAYMLDTVTLAADGRTETLEGWTVTGNFFSVLGLEPERGRLFSPEDDRPGAPRVVVIGHGFWQRRFGGEPVVGKTIHLNGEEFTIVGVAPEGFRGIMEAVDTDVLVPLHNVDVLRSKGRDWLEDRTLRWVGIIGRLAPGVSRRQAQAALDRQARLLDQAWPETPKSRRVSVTAASPILPLELEFVRPIAELLTAAAFLLLLITAINAVNLLALKTLRRRKDLAVELALGANRPWLLRQVVLEALLLSLATAAVGLGVAFGGTLLLGTYIPEYASSLGIDSRLVVFTLGAAFVTALVVGVIPMLRLSRAGLVPALKGSGSATPARWRWLDSRQALVVAQVALSLILLVFAGLVLRSLSHLMAEDPGFETDVVVMAEVRIPQRLSTPEGMVFWRRLFVDLARQPGVEAVSTVSYAPFIGYAMAEPIALAELPGDELSVNMNVVAPGYFDLLRIPLLQGRFFNDHDRRSTRGVTVINEAMARRYWPRQDPLGKQITVKNLKQGEPGPAYEVIGVVKDFKYASIGDLEPQPIAYYSIYQRLHHGTNVLVRVRGAPADFVPVIEERLRAMDPDLALGSVRPLASHLWDSLADERLYSTAMTAFGVLGILLAATSIFVATSYSVSRRTREIGIRAAMGATRRSLFLYVVRRGTLPVLAGIVLGLLASVWATRVLASVLFGVSRGDPLTLLTTVLLLAMLAFFACLLPARRAMRLNPVDALRTE